MDVRSQVEGLQALHAETLGDPQVCVAVLDGPVDLSHPCFEGADLQRIPTLVGEAAGAGPMSLHGTHVTSLLFGQPGSPVVGIAPRCRGLIAPVFRDEQRGRVSQLDLARAIEQVLEQGANVISVSGGERTSTDQADEVLERALRRCEDSNVLVVAAVGNDGCACLQVPSAVASVLAVGGLAPDGMPLGSNNWGEAYLANGVLTAGQDLDGAAPGGGVRALTGSSFATPVVSGVAALLLSTQILNGNGADPRGVRSAILQTATPCRPSGDPECRRHLVGRLDVARAHDLISKGGNTAVDSSDLDPMPSQPAQPGTQPPETSSLDTAEVAVAASGQDQPPQVVTAYPAESNSSGDLVMGTAGVHAATASHDVGARPPEPSFPGAASPPAEVPATGRAATGGVRAASDCGCDSGDMKSLVYAIGTIGYDFQTDAQRDGFRQQMDSFEVGRTPPDDDNPEGAPIFAPANPYDPNQLSAYLARNPWVSNKLTWTLNLDRTPIYALEAELPVGMTWDRPFSSPDPDKELVEVVGNPNHLSEILTAFSAFPPVSYVYKVFRDAILGQARPVTDANFVSRVSIPGVLTNRTTRLFSGQFVPVVEVKSRGLHTWNEAALVNAAVDQVETELRDDAQRRDVDAAVSREFLERNIRAFLDKVYFQFRNLGQSPPDRAMNYAATNAFVLTNEIRSGLLSAKYVPGPNEGLYTMDTVTVSKSPYCRMDSDCWDVVVTFMDSEEVRRAKVAYLFTIDVSAELPVSLAPAHRFLVSPYA
ncbi:MAG: S8 family serine peptidase [Pseudonocardiaceae bacterium]